MDENVASREIKILLHYISNKVDRRKDDGQRVSQWLTYEHCAQVS